MNSEASPAAYLRAARDFYVAASHLLNHPSDTPLPMLFLISRSIELSLKSLLLTAGKAANELARKPFRHNLSNLLSVAISVEIVDAMFTPEHRSAVELLSKEYDSSGLGYIEEGRTYLLPRLDLIDEAAALLLKSATYSRN
jgi:HEPN domain-containing protein